MQNIKKHKPLVKREDRVTQSGHKSALIWFTGLSGSGKSTIAYNVEKLLFERGYRTYVLDGDNVRHGLCADLKFTAEDRAENIRRIGEVSKLFVDAGLIVLAAFISPYRTDRNAIRQLIKSDEFIEVYCKADLTICERRDVKGLYAKARKGQIENFTGISAPYEAPLHPEVVLESGIDNVEQCANKLLNYLALHHIVGK